MGVTIRTFRCMYLERTRRPALAAVLALGAIVTLVGCGGDPVGGSPTSSSAPTATSGAPVQDAAIDCAVAPFGDDPLRAEQGHLSQLCMPGAWTLATGDREVIAIVDTGIDLTHPDLAARLVPGINLVQPGEPPQDDQGHGTHVAGIAAAATGNGVGVSGAAPGAALMPVKVLDATGSGSTTTIAEGIVWAVDNGATVVNLSLGGTGPASRIVKGGAINRAIRYANDRGVVVVAAAGNDSTLQVGYRAGVDVIVVNAADDEGAPAEFTNVGDPRAVAAPGVDVLATAPIGPTDTWPNGTGGYERLSGTSMSTPMVSGVVALLLEAGASPAEVADVLAATASNPNADPRLGAGIVDPVAALLSLG
jgi:serine protease